MKIYENLETDVYSIYNLHQKKGRGSLIRRFFIGGPALFCFGLYPPIILRVPPSARPLEEG